VTERFMKVDGKVDGKEMVLDRKTDTLFNAADVAPRDFEAFTVPLDPKGVLEISRRILKAYRQKEPELTVGDLSVVTAEKKKRNEEWAAKKVNRANGATVGDLTPGADDHRDLQSLFVGKKHVQNMGR